MPDKNKPERGNASNSPDLLAALPDERSIVAARHILTEALNQMTKKARPVQELVDEYGDAEQQWSYHQSVYESVNMIRSAIEFLS